MVGDRLLFMIVLMVRFFFAGWAPAKAGARIRRVANRVTVTVRGRWRMRFSLSMVLVWVVGNYSSKYGIYCMYCFSMF